MIVANVMFIQFAPSPDSGSHVRNVREIDADRHGVKMVYENGLLHVKTDSGAEAYYGQGVIARMVPGPDVAHPTRRRGRPPKVKE